MESAIIVTTNDLQKIIRESIRMEFAKLDPSANREPEKNDITDIRGAAEETGLSTSTIYQRGDRIPRIKTPKKVLFSRSALREWVMNGMPDVQQIAAANQLAKAIK